MRSISDRFPYDLSQPNASYNHFRTHWFNVQTVEPISKRWLTSKAIQIKLPRYILLVVRWRTRSFADMLWICSAIQFQIQKGQIQSISGFECGGSIFKVFIQFIGHWRTEIEDHSSRKTVHEWDHFTKHPKWKKWSIGIYGHWIERVCLYIRNENENGIYNACESGTISMSIFTNTAHFMVAMVGTFTSESHIYGYRWIHHGNSCSLRATHCVVVSDSM